jgi:hypothetical protein
MSLDDQEVEVLEGRMRRSLATLDRVAVPALSSIERRRPSAASPLMRGAAILATAAVMIVVGLAIGDRLSALRGDRAASERTAPAVPSVGYGFFEVLPSATNPGNGTASGVALIDELGRQLMPAVDGLIQAKTSPDGRYVALWLSGPQGFELRVLDGVSRSLGPAIFTTTERFTRVNEAMVWASDSSAVLVSTTADDTANTAGTIRANLRAIDRSTGTVRSLLTYSAFTFEPLGWDRVKGAVLASAHTASSGGKTLYLRVSDDGSGATSVQEVDDAPVIANDAATYVASFPTCIPGPCRRFIIHEASTYSVVAQIDLGSRGDPLTTTSANWAVLFRPRSSDVLVYFSRTGKKGVFGIELYSNGGRGARRDLGDLTVAPRSDGTITSPNAYFRADGSAVFYVDPNDSSGKSWSGDVIDLATGAHLPASVGLIRATVLVDAAASGGSPGPTPTEVTACAQASAVYGGTLVGAFTLTAGDLALQDETRNGPVGPRPLRSAFRDYPADTPIVLCYFDGPIAAPGGPPPIPPATFRPYDRFVVAVDPSDRVNLLVAGHRDRIAVAPRMP